MRVIKHIFFIHDLKQEEVQYDPGDHVGVMPSNREEIVESVLERLKEKDFDTPLQLQIAKETLSPLGKIISI